MPSEQPDAGAPVQGEEPAIENFKGTFFYGKKVSDGNYGGDEWGIHVQFDFAPNAEADEFLAQAREAGNWAAMAVYERLGLEFYRDDAGVVRQVISSFPGATVEGAPPVPGGRTSVPADPPYTPEAIKELSGDEAKEAKRAVKEWAAASLEANPSQWWDNRATKRGQQPDYKHKNSGTGYWLD